jgi:2,3-bisphosphoglycerate-dependent phosphoglycerate mutase
MAYLNLRVLRFVKYVSLLGLMVISGCSVSSHSLQIGGEGDALEINKTVVYLSRHAEKSKHKSKDPELSEKGKQTARRLAKYLDGISLDQIYSTPYKRTRNTASAVAEAHNLFINELYLPAHEMARLLVQNHVGHNVLVVGHSNTTPALIEQLGVAEKQSITEDQYGELFIVTLVDGKVVDFKKEMY